MSDKSIRKHNCNKLGDMFSEDKGRIIIIFIKKVAKKSINKTRHMNSINDKTFSLMFHASCIFKTTALLLNKISSIYSHGRFEMLISVDCSISFCSTAVAELQQNISFLTKNMIVALPIIFSVCEREKERD